MEEGSHLASADLVRQVLVAEVLVGGVDILVRRSLSWRNIARCDILAHLSDLLLKGHLLQQCLCPLRRRSRRIPPVSLATGNHQNRYSYQ